MFLRLCSCVILGWHVQINLIYTCKSGSGVADLLLVVLWMQPAHLLPRSYCGMGMQISTKKVCAVLSLLPKLVP